MRNSSTQCSNRSLASWLQPTHCQHVVKNKTSKHRLHYSPKARPFHRNASEQCSGQTQRCASLIKTNCQRQRSNNKKCVRNVSVINCESSTAQRTTEPENSIDVCWRVFLRRLTCSSDRDDSRAGTGCCLLLSMTTDRPWSRLSFLKARYNS